MKKSQLFRLFQGRAPVVALSFVTLAGTPFCDAAVLVNNGPLVTHIGGGAGGADASALQSALTSFGFGVGGSFRLSDGFTISPGETWNITRIETYAYQTGSGTTSTMTGLNFRIWDGTPGDAGSTVVFGDTTTDRLTSSSFSGIYRVQNTSLSDTTRPIMTLQNDVAFQLSAGTYWLDWQVSGSLASGPWVPPISILGSTTTGDALQYNGTTWNPVLDSTFRQGLPFQISGTSVPEIGAYPLVFALFSLGGVFLLRRKS